MCKTNFYFILSALAILAGCADYPPIDPSFSFNIERAVQFSLASTAALHTDTSLVASAPIDTAAYVDSESSAYLITHAEVGRIYLTSSDPNFTLDALGPIAILVGADTVATDTLPQGTVDTNFTLTHADISKYMRGTVLNASLRCNLQSAPKDTVALRCGMTVIYVANVRQ